MDARDFYKFVPSIAKRTTARRLDIRKIREVCDADAADGFDPTVCLPQSRYEPQRMFEELLAIVRERITDTAAAGVGREDPDRQPRRSAADPGGPAQSSRLRGRLAGTHLERDADGDLPGRQVRRYYDELEPPLDKSMAVAGAILHDSASSASWSSGPTARSTRPAGR